VKTGEARHGERLRDLRDATGAHLRHHCDLALVIPSIIQRLRAFRRYILIAVSGLGYNLFAVWH
jgi:hypothetical protein